MSVDVFTNDEPLITAHFTDGPVPETPLFRNEGLMLLLAASSVFDGDFVGESDTDCMLDSMAAAAEINNRARARIGSSIKMSDCGK